MHLLPQVGKVTQFNVHDNVKLSSKIDDVHKLGICRELDWHLALTFVTKVKRNMTGNNPRINCNKLTAWIPLHTALN